MASDLPAEFALIARHFRPLAGPGALDLRDDAAVLMPPPGRELVLTADAMVAGVHFLPDDPPDLVGRKLLRVNLSDLAAKGATPLGYLMTVSTPRTTPDAWFAGFAAGLAQDQREYGVTLLGGDTTSTPGPISLSLTAIGHVAPGQAVHRAGAAAGRRHLGHRHDRRRRARPRRGARPSSPTRPATCSPATACRSRASAWRSPASPRPAWMSPTGWCRTSATSAAPAALAPRSTPPSCRCPTRRALPARTGSPPA